MSKEEIIEIFNNLKEYIQNKIDSGEHKIYYNDLGWDVKCIDCINAIDNILELYNNQKEEIEELKKPKDNIQVVYGGRSYGKTLKAKDNNYISIKGYNQFIDLIKDKLDLLKIKVVEEKNEPVIYADTDSFHVPFID